jgi:hypothetical protein
MILQVITPQMETFNLPVSFPKDYLGKQVHCLFYITEETKTVSLVAPSRKKPSDFFGIFNKNEADNFEKHTQQIRKEWDRSI